jgi:hypothetical protein
MKSKSFVVSFLIGSGSILMAGTLLGATHYVDANGTTPIAPYTNWATAANNIQDAVDAADWTDDILVTNGVYQTGGTYAGMMNRVVMDRGAKLHSVNGPAVTVIVGYQAPGTTNGDSAVRCLWVGDQRTVEGFTLTNGATLTQPYCLQSCGGGVWCESTNVFVSNCILTGNSAAQQGGGAFSGTLSNCFLVGNSAQGGGGAAAAVLNRCTLVSNSCAASGGGAYDCTLHSSTLIANSAISGGGAYGCTLNSCVVTRNRATGGAGGGAMGSTLNNCTITGNWTDGSGGGVRGAAVNNCIIFYNTSLLGGDNYDDESALNYCCTTPLPMRGTQNIANEPQLANSSHLSAGSPCRSAGSAGYSTGLDVDGEAWSAIPAIGCDEYYSGSARGALNVMILASETSVAAGFAPSFQAVIEGRVSASIWDFADGFSVSNRPYVWHAWDSPGDYAVKLTVYNEDHPSGVVATMLIHVIQAIHFVAQNSPHPAKPYSSWDTAAQSIQDAVDAASVTGALVLVSNGVYQTGGRAVYAASNRVAITKPLRVQSLNGPDVTAIMGYQLPGRILGSNAIRCVYLTNGALLVGFTLTNGATYSPGAPDPFTRTSGGGAWCESTIAILSNCVLAGNAAVHGGGSYSGALNNCTLTTNTASSEGGGAFLGVLNDCTLSFNGASVGGGAFGGLLNNCNLLGNQVPYTGGGANRAVLNNCLLSGNSATGMDSYGGGAYFASINNCTLIANSAARYGGGAYDSQLNNCILTGNSVGWAGGGVAYSLLNNCTLSGNSSEQYGGGADTSRLNNCIVFYNTAINGGDNYNANSTLNYCCTTPAPTNGVGSITNEPLFIDQLADLRLHPESPCINAGKNAYVPGSLDLDGKPRIVGATVDIGAHEFQTPASMISYAWLQQFGLTTDGSSDYLDPDNDGLNNWQEWRAGTSPFDSASTLRVLRVFETSNGLTVVWQSVPGVSYFIERSMDLSSPFGFTRIYSDLMAYGSETYYTDIIFPYPGLVFYRVGVP